MTLEGYSAVLPLFFLGVWSLISVAIAQFSGWGELASIYPADGTNGRQWRFQSARMRWSTSYNNALTVGVNAGGLRLSVFFPFRLGHPPLFIPWSEIAAESKRQWLRNWVELRFARADGIPLVISRALAERMAAEVGEVFRWAPSIDSRARYTGGITT